MAVNDIYQLQWASELDGAAAVNTLYYRQAQELTGPLDPEQQLAEDWFEAPTGPWGLAKNRFPTDLAINLTRIQRVSPVPGLVNFRNVAQTGSAVPALESYMPTTLAMQWVWQQQVPFEDDGITNRMFQIGHLQENVWFNSWNDSLITWATSWGPVFQEVQSLGAPTGLTWRLQFRRNTQGPMEDVIYADASLPFIRCFPARIQSRTTRILSA